MYEHPFSSFYSVKNSHQAAVKFSRKLQKLNYPISFTNFKIHNIVATCTTAPTNLNLLSQQHWNRCTLVDTERTHIQAFDREE